MGGFVFGAGGDAAGPDDGRVGCEGGVHRGDSRLGIVVDGDQFGTIGSGSRCISEDHGDGLTDEDDAIASEHQLGAGRWCQVGQIVRGQDRVYAGYSQRSFGINSADIGVGKGAQNEARVQHAVQLQVTRVFEMAGHFRGTVNHRCGFTNK